jgi:hypothetical protein
MLKVATQTNAPDNAIFEPLWSRNYIDHVQITVAESVGVEHRAGYYDKAGVLRDMFQNHLLQLLTLTAMEPPSIFSADASRDEKVKVLRDHAARQLETERSGADACSGGKAMVSRLRASRSTARGGLRDAAGRRHRWYQNRPGTVQRGI